MSLICSPPNCQFEAGAGVLFWGLGYVFYVWVNPILFSSLHNTSQNPSPFRTLLYYLNCSLYFHRQECFTSLFLLMLLINNLFLLCPLLSCLVIQTSLLPVRKCVLGRNTIKNNHTISKVCSHDKIMFYHKSCFFSMENETETQMEITKRELNINWL